MDVPLVILAFNRPAHTRRLLEALAEVRPSRLFVVADGPRAGHPDDAARCAEVRALFENLPWTVEITRDFAAENLGLRKRVSTGLSAVFAAVPEAIVLEDDCIPHPTFFTFCAEMLVRYRDDVRVGVITGDNFQPQPFDCGASYYFSRYPHCWGWATWRRAWAHFDEAMTAWPARRDAGWLDCIFPGRPRAAAYWQQMFSATHSRKLSSWAFGWTFACWAAGLLTVTPRVNLVENIGHDADGTHTKDSERRVPKAAALDFPLTHPAEVARLESADAHIQANWFGEIDPPAPRRRSLLDRLFGR